VHADYFHVLRHHHSDVLCAKRASATAFLYYNQYKAPVDIRTCEIIEGNLPARQTRLVLAWADLHQEELMADWRLVTNGEQPFKIEPLK